MKELELKYGCNPNQKPAKIYMKNGEIANGTNGTGEKVTLNSLNTSITLFELNSIADSAETEPIDKFYRVELVNLSTLSRTIINTKNLNVFIILYPF